MLYKIITVHGNLNLKTICIACVHIEETGGVWKSEVIHYQNNPIVFSTTVAQITAMPILDFNKMEADVALKLCKELQDFITTNQLEHKIDFIANYGLQITAELDIENNAALAIQLGYPIIGNFKKMNQLLGGADSLFQINTLLTTQHNNLEYRNVEAIALLAALRWREAYNVLAEQTGASKNHIAGSIWLGNEA